MSYRLLGIVWLLMSASVSIAAEAPFSGDSGKPIDISSDTLEVLQEHSKAIFSGHVVAIQGGTRLKADAMTVFYHSGAKQEEKADAPASALGNNKISRINVDGNVFMTTPKETASGAKGYYNVDKHMIYLYNNVVLTQGQNVLKGDSLVYNLDTGQSQVKSPTMQKGDQAKQPGRVRAVFIPEKKDQ